LGCRSGQRRKKANRSYAINSRYNQNWLLKKQLLGLLEYQPNITTNELAKVKAKVLIIAGDEG